MTVIVTVSLKSPFHDRDRDWRVLCVLCVLCVGFYFLQSGSLSEGMLWYGQLEEGVDKVSGPREDLRGVMSQCGGMVAGGLNKELRNLNYWDGLFIFLHDTLLLK